MQKRSRLNRTFTYHWVHPAFDISERTGARSLHNPYQQSSDRLNGRCPGRNGSLFRLCSSGAFEEVLLRGYAFRVLIRGTGKAVAVCVTSCTFGLAHLANPNVGFLAIINTAMAGMWLSIAYLKTRSLWLPAALHISWNTTEGLIFGFPVSGMMFPSVLKSTHGGNEWITGGNYGPEGGVLSLVVLVIGTIFIIRSKWIHPSPKAPALWEAAE
jgi:hypothetical protein